MSAGRRRRLLFLMAFPPRLDGTHGGTRAMAGLLAALLPRHDIAALYLRGRDEPPMDEALASRCALVEEVPRDAGPGLVSRLRHRARVLRSMAGGMPEWPAYWSGSGFAGVAHRTAGAWRPDVVHVEFHVMAQFTRGLPTRAPVVLTPYEPGAAAAAERAATAHGLRALRLRLDAGRWRRWEASIMRDADAVVAYTTADQAVLASAAGRTPVVHIPIGTAIPERPLDPVGATPPEVLFVGNYMHPPNTAAALVLLREIVPIIRRELPDARVMLVGPSPPDAIRDAAGTGVTVTGEVPSVMPYLERAAVVVAPIWTGGGMRVKVLEALAAGKAVVASPLAVAGLPVQDGEQVLVAPDPPAFAAALTALLRDPSRRARLGRAAHEWSRATIGYEPWADAYDRLYDRLDERRDGSR